MIKISIETNGEQVCDEFNKENTNRLEVATALLSLKHIEQELLNIEFDNEVEWSE